MRLFGFLVGVLALGSTLVPNEARAGKYDLDLTPLGEQTANGIQQNDGAFRSLSSQLGVLMAPQPVDPADSLGLSGFALSADISINTIAEAEDYWDLTADGPDTVAPTLQVMGRKGLWPGFEVGGGATHLFDSRMWAMSGYGKFAFHEGFHHLPIPSIAVRASFSRLLGAKDFNMTTAAPAVNISHLFGLGKSFSVTPYVGYEALIIIARSTVLDATPNCDEFADAYNEMACAGLDASVPSEFVFQNAGAIIRHRPFFGARMIFSVIRLGFEAMFVPGGNSQGSLDGVSVEDASALQQQYTFSVGLDF
ncbi:MAG: hypothetical protein AAF721_39540 [Myxococcota bacterium]